MPIHDEVLRAALRLCRERGEWTFRADEIVRALPHLNESSVRTHVVSRCCTNAPRNHPHKWDYFRRVRRAVYEIRPPYRTERRARVAPAGARGKGPEPAGDALSERGGRYGGTRPRALRDTIHAIVERDGGTYVGECVEVAVVSQGRSLDELLANLREAVALHLEGEDPGGLGLTPAPRLSLLYETAALPDGGRS